MMVRRSGQVCLLLAGLVTSVSFAQRGGRSSSSPGGGRSLPRQTAEEASQAAAAKEWAGSIEKLRASAPPPPLPKIRFPSQNELLLSRLRWAEDPRRDVAQYLDKLWKDAKEPIQRRVAVETFWHDAEKPKWVRPAIEEFFRQHSNGAMLRPPEEPADLSKGAVAQPPPRTSGTEGRRDGDKP